MKAWNKCILNVIVLQVLLWATLSALSELGVESTTFIGGIVLIISVLMFWAFILMLICEDLKFVGDTK